MCELIMLGTGNALVTRCYNTCFALRTPGACLLVDAGGGNGILRQLELAGIALGSLSAMYLTHAHTDHILGAVWVVRAVAQRVHSGTFHVYGHDRALHVLDSICRLTLPAKVLSRIGTSILFHEVKDGDTVHVGDMELQCFDILSTKEKQFGFRATLPDGRTLACLGDEPYNDACRPYAEGSDWLMCEAFCLYRDRDTFKPYEKHHSTALEAGRLAQSLGVKNLLLYHTEDTDLPHRKAFYTAEAAQEFTGHIVVPDDLERVEV